MVFNRNLLAPCKNQVIPLRIEKSISGKIRDLAADGVHGEMDNACLDISTSKIKALYPRLKHFLYGPKYNHFIVEEIAEEQKISVATLLSCLEKHFNSSPWNEMLFYLSPPTHGQFNSNIYEEAKEWEIHRWKEQFISSGYIINNIVGIRHHHLFE